MSRAVLSACRDAPRPRLADFCSECCRGRHRTAAVKTSQSGRKEQALGRERRKAPDERWNNDTLQRLSQVTGGMLEFVDASANYQQFLRIADPESSKLEIEKVNLRLPALQKLIKDGKGKKRG